MGEDENKVVLRCPHCNQGVVVVMGDSPHLICLECFTVTTDITDIPKFEESFAETKGQFALS